MRKILKILLLLLCFVMLCSCGSSSANEVFDLEFETGTGENNIDFNGININFAVVIDNLMETSIEGNVLGYTQDTLFAEKASNRVSEVEKDLNCSITLNTNAKREVFALAAAAGSDYCDALMCNTDSIQDWAKAGFLVGLSGLSDYIDFTDSAKWGNPNLLEVAFHGEDVYGVLPAAWPELSYVSFGYPLVANVDLMGRLGVSDPREYVENLTWNWDQFLEELVKCTVDNGTDTVYGMITHYPYMSQMFLRSNGVTFAQVTEDGKCICGYYTDAGRRALEFIKDMYNGTYASYILKDGHGNATESANNFINGLGCYTFTPAHCIFGVSGEISSKMTNYAILPTPYGPDVEPGYNGGLYHSQYYFLSIPRISDYNDAAAVVIDRIFEPFEGLETYEEIKDYMTRNYFFNDKDADWYFEMRNNAVLNYDYQTGFASRKIPEDICTSTSTVTELLERYESQIQSILDETVVPMMSVYDIYWKD